MPTIIFHSMVHFIYLYLFALFSGLTRYSINRLITRFRLSQLSGSLGSCEPDIGSILQSLSVKSGRVARNKVAVASRGSIGANWLPYQVQFAFSLRVKPPPPPHLPCVGSGNCFPFVWQISVY
jgi:hypothetical protein